MLCSAGFNIPLLKCSWALLAASNASWHGVLARGCPSGKRGFPPHPILIGANLAKSQRVQVAVPRRGCVAHRPCRRPSTLLVLPVRQFARQIAPFLVHAPECHRCVVHLSYDMCSLRKVVARYIKRAERFPSKTNGRHEGVMRHTARAVWYSCLCMGLWRMEMQLVCSNGASTQCHPGCVSL